MSAINTIIIINYKRGTKMKQTKSIKRFSNIFVYFIVFLSISLFSAFSVSASQPTINLGNATNFAILSEVQVTDASPSTTSITGDVGVHPEAGTFIEDVSCTTVDGTIYDNNAGYTGGFDSNVDCFAPNEGVFLGNAIQDMDDARLEVQGRLPNDVTKDTNEMDSGLLSPTTPSFKPGLHTWSTAVSITTSITLDCQDDANGVFIFQIAQTLDLASGAQIFLINNCQASNIFWTVSDQVTLGTTSVFEGTILGVSGISTLADSTVNGRLLAQTAVTLDGTGNTVSLPVYEAPVLTTITVSPSTANITVGFTQQLNATSLDQFDFPIVATINYTTSNSSVATVDTDGLVTAIADGSATINASSGSVSGTSTITVEAPVLTTITVSPSTANITVGFTQQLNATSLDQFDFPIVATINYTTSNSSVATVDTDGLVTAIADGNATINASSGSVSGTSTITVELPAPVLNPIGAKSVTQDVLLNFTINATSSEGLNLTFTIEGKPTTANFTDNLDGSATFIWTSNSSDVGITNVNFTVTDGIKSTTESVVITVNAVSQDSGGNSGGGGSSSSKKYTEWSVCSSEGIRTRTYTRLYSASIYTEEQSCTPIKTNVTIHSIVVPEIMQTTELDNIGQDTETSDTISTLDNEDTDENFFTNSRSFITGLAVNEDGYPLYVPVWWGKLMSWFSALFGRS